MADDTIPTDADLGIEPPIQLEPGEHVLTVGKNKPASVPSGDQSPSDADLGIGPIQTSGLLSNTHDEGWLSGAAKGTGTAIIKGLANIPGQYKNYGNLVDYLFARGHAAVTGRPLEEVQQELQQRQASVDNSIGESLGKLGVAGKMIDGLTSPMRVLPSGQDIAAPILKMTGEYEPDTAWGKAGMAGVETATSMIGPGGGAKVPGASLKAAIKPSIKAAPVNVAAGAGAQATTDLTGDPLYGMAVGLGTSAIGEGATKVAKTIATPFAQDIPGVGRMFSGTREAEVGKQILAASENPQGVERKLFPGPMRPNDTLSTETIPGSQPTLAQWVGTDQGLHNAEMTARNEAGTAGPNDPFAAVDKAQNAARVTALEQGAPAGADTMKVPEAFQTHLDHIDQSTEAAVNRLTQDAQTAAPRGTQNPEDVGDTVRTAIEGAKKAEKELYGRAYNAIDPEKKLNVVASPPRDTANQVLDSIGELTPPIENEALRDRILPRMQKLPDVVPLRDLGELDKDVTNVMFKERRQNGDDSPDYKRLVQLKVAIKGAINNAVANQEKYEAGAVARGEMHPGDTMASRVRGLWQDEQVSADRQRSNAATGTVGARAGTERPAGEGPGTAAGNSGANGEAGRGLSTPTGDQGIPPKAGLTNEATNVQGTTGGTAGASQTPQDKAQAIEARRQALAEAGVNTIARGGELYTDTRGKGTQFHGTSEPNLKPSSEHYSTKNYYGQGFYTTDAAPDIAYGYSKKGSERTGGRYLYEVKENRPLKIADGEAPLQGDVGNLVSELGKRFDENPYHSTLDGVLADAIDEKPKNLRELYDHVRDIGTDEGLSADTIQEVFDSINHGLRQLGYNGLSHTGGQRTGNAPHKVVVYFDPEHDITVRRTPFDQGRVSEQPAETAAKAPQGLTPNVDQAAAARVNAAKAAYTNYAQTYKSEPVASALKTTGAASDYKMQASALPARIFVSGDKGYETMGAFLKAANDSPDAVAALKDHIRSDLAKAAVNKDGMVDPNKFNTWHKNHKGALRAIEERSPGFTNEFSTAARATDQALAAQAARKQQLGDFQKSQASAFLGKQTPTEVENTIGQILQNKDLSSIDGLIKQASTDPAVLDGLKKGGIDWMARTFTDASGDRWMKSAPFRKFVNERYDALAKLYGTDHANMFRAIADDLESADQPAKATAPKRGPGTAKDVAPFLKKAVEAAKHPSLLHAMTVGAVGGNEAHGLPGAITGAIAAGGAYGLGTLRAAGVKTMQDMFRDALSNPERARYYVSKVQPKEHALSAVTRSLRRELLLAKPIGIGQNEPTARASGGRVNTRDYPAKKASALEKQANRIRKAYGGELRPLLGMDDNVVARALRLAHH